MRSSRLCTVAALALMAYGSSGCAEVYTPRPSSAIVVSGNGGNGYRVYKNGEATDGEWSVRDAVSGDPRAEAEADTANSQRLGGMIVGFLGAAAVGAGGALLGIDAGNNTNNFPTAVGDAGIGLLAGGVALAIIGGVLQGSAHTHMFNAVNMYNDDLALRTSVPVYSVQAPAPPAYVAPGPGYQAKPIDLTSPPLIPPPPPAPPPAP